MMEAAIFRSKNIARAPIFLHVLDPAEIESFCVATACCSAR
jgi:hypothetical protein